MHIRLVNKKRFATVIIVVGVMMTGLVTTAFSSAKSEQTLPKPVAIEYPQEVKIPQVEEVKVEPVKEEVKVEVEDPYEDRKIKTALYIQGKYSKNISVERTNDLIDWVYKYGLAEGFTQEEIDRTFAQIEWESEGFKNKRSPFAGEDSDGYVQMQSSTRDWLRKIEPTLPYVASQLEFRRDPEVQIRYMVAYIKYANQKFEKDYTKVVSSYNMGITNTVKGNINEYYVKQVTMRKENLIASIQ